MLALKMRLLSTTFLPLMVGMGVVLAVGSSSDLSAQSQNPCAAKKPVAGKASPCAAGAAAPCNPCAAKGAASDRTYTIQQGDSLADVAERTYGDRSLYRMLADYNGLADPDLILVGQVIRIPANPCAAQKAAAANPCNPCNPCAAANPCNPCNPCAAQGMAGASDCVVPRLQTAAAQNPCAATRAANPCNPCAATNPCRPCAATNPCKPGAANNPCNPGAVQSAALTGEAATIAQEYQGWERVNTAPYVSATHGSRYVNNYPGPEAAEAYRQFEEIGVMPAGGRIAKDSFTVSPDGRVGVGPLFIMEKMAEGFNEASADWRYAMIMPDGSLFGVTNGPGSQNVQFCAECHAIVADDQDSLYFLPEEFRATSG